MLTIQEIVNGEAVELLVERLDEDLYRARTTCAPIVEAYGRTIEEASGKAAHRASLSMDRAA